MIKIYPGGFPSSSVIKNLPANAGDVGYILGLGSSPGEVNGNPLQYSCLGNPMDRGAWWATVHGVTKSQTLLSLHTSPNDLNVFSNSPLITALKLNLFGLGGVIPTLHSWLLAELRFKPRLLREDGERQVL